MEIFGGICYNQERNRTKESRREMIDSHAHYDYIKFDGDRDKILQECRETGIDLIINPVITIESNEDMREKLKVHCFCGDLETARIYVEDLGLYLGVGGKVTYPAEEDLRNAVTQIPLERILLETDAPFVRPKDCKGKRNTSLNLPRVVNEIANLKGISEEEVVEVTTQNVKALFGIEK